MMRRKLTAYLAAAVLLLACLVAGCSGDDQSPEPEVPDSFTVAILDDASVAMTRGSHHLEQRLQAMQILDEGGLVLHQATPQIRGHQHLAQCRHWQDVYPEVGLDLSHSRGGVKRLMLIAQPLDLPATAHTIEFVENLHLSGDLRVVTEQGILAVGQTLLVDGGFDIRDEGANLCFHVPAGAAWDADGRNRPWVSYRLTLLTDHCLQVGTRVPASWVADPAARYPLAVDPTVLPGAPGPLLASVFLAPTSPRSLTYSLAATYNATEEDSLEVSIDWGDGTISTDLTNYPVQELHSFGHNRERVTVKLQISDFNVDSQGNLAPRTARRIFYLFGPFDGKPGHQRHAAPCTTQTGDW